MTDFRPTATPEALRRRAELLRRTRRFFDERGYVEVETPLVSFDTVVDRHLDPFVIEVGGGAARGARAARLAYLQTSPELAMKRILAAGGLDAIYQITRSFRAGELGERHNPEFTIVEWYRVGDDAAAQMALTDDLAGELLGDRLAAPALRQPAERLTYREAFVRYAGIDPIEVTTAALRAHVAALGIAAPPGLDADDRDGWLDLLLVERVEPRLGRGRATLLHGYPASQAALARRSAADPRVAERFELYVDGVELANGYHELTDAAELRARNVRQNELRVADGKAALPVESRLLDAMDAGLPDCAGVALGFDRVVMLSLGARCLAEVLAFPFDRA